MLASLIIVFREVFEAGLIVGIVLAATRGVARRGVFIAAGVAAGVVGAALMASFAGVLSDALAGRHAHLVGDEAMILKGQHRGFSGHRRHRARQQGANKNQRAQHHLRREGRRRTTGLDKSGNVDNNKAAHRQR